MYRKKTHGEQQIAQKVLNDRSDLTPPLSETVQKMVSEPLVRLPIPLNSPILVVHDMWIQMYCEDEKHLEIRSRPCNKARGTKIYLSPNTSGGVGVILAVVVFRGSRKISSEKDWKILRPRHRSPHKNRPYGDRTHAWIFTDCERLETPIPYLVPIGMRAWRKYTAPHKTYAK